MELKNVYVVGYTVQGQNLKDVYYFEDFVVKVIPDKTIDAFECIESEIKKEYQELGYIVDDLLREEVYSFSPIELYCHLNHSDATENITYGTGYDRQEMNT